MSGKYYITLLKKEKKERGGDEGWVLWVSVLRGVLRSHKHISYNWSGFEILRACICSFVGHSGLILLARNLKAGNVHTITINMVYLSPEVNNIHYKNPMFCMTDFRWQLNAFIFKITLKKTFWCSFQRYLKYKKFKFHLKCIIQNMGFL